MDFPKFIANCRRVVEKTAHFIENWQRLPKQDQIGQDTRKKKEIPQWENNNLGSLSTLWFEIVSKKG